MATASFPLPGNFLIGGKGNSGQRTDGGIATPKPDDSRIRWLNNVRSQLVNERAAITSEMKRNVALYEDKHWETFGSGKRAPWKFPGIINYIGYIADTKAALMADNKPKFVFTTPRREDSWQAEILNAALEEFWEEDSVQPKIEVGAKLSILRKISYFKLDYDPNERGGKGGATLRVVDAINCYVNKEATNLFDAEIFLHEYTLPVGEIYGKYKKLRGNKAIFGATETEEEQEGNETESGSRQGRQQPASSYLAPDGTTKHTAPYAAAESKRDQYKESRRCLVREVWTRPRGPAYMTKVDSISFNAGGEVVCDKKYLEFADGHLEPVQTVVMGNGNVYELPLSAVYVLKHAADLYGGIPVIDAQDAYEAVVKEREVALYPTGRRMIAVGNVVADDGANPFAHGRIPYVKLPERPALRYYPRCSIDRAYSLQDSLNRINGLIMDTANTTGNPLWRMPLNSDVADEDITNAPGAIQREDLMSLKYGKREKGLDLPPYIMAYMQFIISQLRELSGLTEAATGGKFKGQQAAETVSMYQEAAGIAFRPSLRCVEQAIVEMGYLFRGVVAQFYTQERIAQYKDNAGIEKHVAYIGTRLTAEMSLRVKAGSMLPSSPSARLNFALQLINTPAYDIPELLRNLEEVGIIESATLLLRRLQRERADPSMNWLIPALTPPGGKQKKKARTSGGRSARRQTPLSAASRKN